MESERKLIKLKDQERLMSLEEVYIQFKNFLFKSIQSWKGKYEIDDLLSVTTIGLSKAYKAYNAETGVLFMTYLSHIVNNELRMHERKEKKHLKVNSLDEAISNQKSDSEKITLMDMVADGIDYEAECVEGITYKEIEEIINSLDKRDKQIVIGFYIDEKKQKQIGENLGISQSYISRLLKRIPEIIRKKYERGKIMHAKEPKITKEQLMEEAKIHGTGREAVTVISKKYGLTERTVDTYLGKYGIRDKLKEESINTELKEVQIAKPTETKDNLSDETIMFKTKISSNKILQPLVLRGRVMEYKVQENSFAIRNLTGTTTLVLNANEIDDFIKELKALKEVV